MGAPSECIAPGGVDVLREGLTLYPLRAPIAFATNRRAVEICTPEHLTFSRREVEGRPKVRWGWKTLGEWKMSQHLG